MKNQISVIIHTYNEEKNIKECIGSAKLLNGTIIVIDMESSDKTGDIVKKENIEIISFPHADYVEPAREFGIRKAQTDWVLLLDADERITPDLAREISNVASTTPKTYYKIPRKNVFGKLKWLKHGGWWPDYQIRLINKTYFKKWPSQIHSTPVIEGKSGYLSNPIIHYFHGNLEQMVEKTIIFENMESDLLYRADKPVRTLTFFRKFMGELFRRLIKQAGFFDGQIGIIESIYQAFSKTITYLFLFEKYHNEKESSK